MFFQKFYSPEPSFAGATRENTQIVDHAAPVQVMEPETVIPEQASPVIETVTTEPPGTPAEVAPVVTQADPVSFTAPPAAEPTLATPPVVQKTWEDLLKEDGFDEKDLAMLKHRKNTGSYKDYLNAMSVDYTGMQPEEVMRRDLKEQYPTLSPESFERLYRKEVTMKYNLDTDLAEPEDTELGKDLLKHDAEKIRSKFIEKQNAYLIPDKDLGAEQQRQIEEQQRNQQAQVERFTQSVISSQVAQTLTKDKKLVLDAGDGASFNYEVEDANDVMDLLLKPEKYGEAMTTKDASGNPTPDIAKTMLMAAVAKNPTRFIKALINHGKNLGKKELHDNELENVGRSSVTPVVGMESLADAFRNRGVKNY